MPTLNQDISFLKFYKTLNEAIVNEMPPITELPEARFIQQLPNETFKQITNCDTGVGFVGGMTAELVTCDGVVFQDITTNFYYEQRLVNGVNQIAFEFGYTGIDEPSKVFFLKLTDTTNNDVWFSYPFMITTYNEHESTFFEYGSKIRKFGIPYDLLPYKQSVRIANCYRLSPNDKEEKTLYTLADAHQVSFDTATTFLEEFFVSRMDGFINKRLATLFNHEFIYIKEYNSKKIRATVSEYKRNKIEGSTNWMKDNSFMVNYQNEYLPDSYEIYQPLQVVSRIVPHQSVWTPATIVNQASYLYFNKNIAINDGDEAYLYLDGIQIDTATTPLRLQANDNALFVEFDLSSLPVEDIELGRYSIVTPNVSSANNIENWNGYTLNEWYFDVQEGDWNSSDFNNSDWLTN